MLETTNTTNIALMAAGTALKAGGSADAKTVNAINFILGDKIYLLAAQATLDLSTAAGTLVLPTAKSTVVYCMTTTDGTLSYEVGTYGATRGVVVEPIVPSTKSIFAKIRLDNATGSNFTIGTTALDTASMTITYQDVYLINYRNIDLKNLA